ncbi:1-deoxy-D-xylulose-5-phosphate synthase [Breznakia sp. OttesenSCG-928-G09]|nr:1-deoxy-D-xylulose-5-phosphate synthase [Breznakia sp. OttesenSCG-928-G09]
MNVLDIKSPQDIKNLNINELEVLSEDIRAFLIDSISKTGGHLSSNLGVVELTLALHYVFNSSKDKFIFDVGHQAYIHKILTGRAKDFPTLRQYGGMSGFQKRYESEHDPWEAGHSSTSLSAALGFAVARDLNKDDFQVLPIIGDGALSSGMSFEALNQIGSENRKMIIVFNDNEMSISKNVGAMSHVYTRLRSSKGYTGLKKDLSSYLSHNKVGNVLLDSMRNIKNNIKNTVVDSSFFDEFGLDYIGPVDGHDLKELVKVFEAVQHHNGPIVVHVITTKGKGYEFAECDHSGKWHGVGKFNVETGQSLSAVPFNHLDWSSVLSEALIELASENPEILAITPAMSSGAKLDKFAKLYPGRFFDCGIAEEHALTFSAALALNGKRPFINVYSSFLQRAYDQINHDIARMNLPVVIGVDRAGIVGEDGDTHHGVFDISALRSIPNLIITQPMNADEARNMLFTAFQNAKPWLIRVPRGTVEYKPKPFESIEIGTWTRWDYSENVEAIVIAYGNDVEKIIQKAKVNEINIAVINARFIKPLDAKMLKGVLNSDIPLIVYETDMLAGGFSSAILEFKNDHHITKDVIRFGIQDHFVTHGSIPQLRKSEKIDINTLFDEIIKVIS